MTDPTPEGPDDVARRLRAKTTMTTDGAPALNSLDQPTEETSHDDHD